LWLDEILDVKKLKMPEIKEHPEQESNSSLKRPSQSQEDKNSQPQLKQR
jgi:hypothetical protein